MAALMRRIAVAALAACGLAGCYRTAPVQSHALAAQAVAEAQRTRATTPLPEGKFTLEAAVQAAKQADPSFEAMKYGIAAAEAAEVAAGAWENPELRLQTLSFDEYASGESGLRLGYRTAIPVPGVPAANEAIAQADTRMERAKLVQLERALEAEVARLYFEVALAAQESAAAERELRVVSSWAQAIEDEVDAMRSGRLDSSKAALDLTAAQVAVQIAKAHEQTALGRLAARVGQQGLSSGALASALPHPADEPQPPPVLWVAEEVDAAVEMAAAAIDAAAALGYVEESRRWPWFRFVQVSYSFDSRRPVGETWAAVMALEVPLYSQNAGGIARAQALQRAAELQLTAAALRAQWRAEQSTAAIRGAADALLAIERALEPAAKAAVAEAQATEQQGGARAVERWDIEVRAARAEAQRVRAHRRYVEAWLQHLDARAD